MPETLEPPAAAPPARRALGLELALVVIVALATLVPGISSYSLVDPWETHYGEVGRMMLQNHDYVHLEWPQDNEGFRSKPVLMFWMMAASMRTVGLAADGGYSGEMAHDGRTMIAIRMPFILTAVLGLTLVWWMLARLVSRRLAWLALLVVGSCPFFCLVARQAIPDMPLAACVMAAIAMFTMAIEDGDRPIETVFTVRRFAVDQRHVLIGICGAFLLVQAVYLAIYFTVSPRLGVRFFPVPPLILPLFIALCAGGLISVPWETMKRSPLALPVRGLVFPIVWAFGGNWADTQAASDRIIGMTAITSMRQIYMLWYYVFIAVSILAKGPPGLAVVGLAALFHVLLTNGWRALYNGQFEIKRGILLALAIFLPWHLAMWLKEGPRFIDEYLFTHILNRAAVGVDNSPGTFEYYTSQIGHGMWLWAALLPAAVAACVLRARTDTREGRVRFMMVLWAISAVAFFSLVQTKFHHYILPAVPALGVLVAFFLDDMVARRDRLHPLYAALGIGIVLMVCRDLVWEPERWIEMFVFRYDRPWPAMDPWFIDPSDGFLALGLVAAGAVAIAALPWRRIGVAAVCAAGFAICIWAQQVYMPDAGRHWGMGDAARTYYKSRSVYGEKLVYFSARDVYDAWHDVKNTWSFETFVPDTLQIGQPMTIRIALNKAEDERITLDETGLVGHVTRIGDHDVEVTFDPGERAKLDPLIVRGKTAASRGRQPVHAVEADRLIAWQLYWRGENFWSGDEIWGWLPEMKTAFVKTDNVDFLKYLNDHTKAPLGRRYFVITEAGRLTSVRSLLPTTRARDTFEVLDTTSNKFALGAFYL